MLKQYNLFCTYKKPKYELTKTEEHEKVLSLTLYPQILKDHIIKYHVRCSRGEMHIGHSRLYVGLSLIAFPHYCTDIDVSWGMAGGAL